MDRRWLSKAVVFLALLLLAFGVATAEMQGSARGGAEVIYQRIMPGALDRCVIVNEGQFTMKGLRSLSETFLAYETGLFVSRLAIVTQRENLGLVRAGKGVYDIDFSGWLARFEEEREKHFPIAELIQIGSSAVLRVRWPDSRQERIVIRGDDILEQRVGPLRVSLNWLDFSYAPLLKKTSLHFSLQTDHPPSETEAQAVAAHFYERVRARPVLFGIRSDPWFIDDDFYPFVNPFFPIPARPSRDDYLRSGSFLCDLQAGAVSCTKFGGPLHGQ